MSLTADDATFLPENLSTELNEITPNITANQLTRNESIVMLKIVTLSAIFVLIVIGNSAVLLALIMSKIKLRRMYFFLFHLSLADLITAMFNVFPQLIWEITHSFYGGTLLCKIVKYLQLLGPYLSSFTLCATAIDRYQAICYPLESRSKLNRSSLKVTIAWIISLIFCIPQAIIFSYREISPNQFNCWAKFIQPWGERIYVTWYAVSSFFIPFIILIFTFSNICIELWKNSRRIRKWDLARYGDADTIGGVYEDKCDKIATHLIGVNKNATQTDAGEADAGAVMTGSNGGASKNTSGCRLCVDLRGGIGRTRIARQTSDQWKPRSHSDPGYFSKAKIKTIKLTVVIIICYIVCSSPFNCVQIWASWIPGAQQSPLYTGKLLLFNC